MGIFNTVSKDVQYSIQQTTNTIVDDLVSKRIPSEYARLQEAGAAVLKKNAVSEVLSAAGINASNIGAGDQAQQKIVNTAIQHATTLVDAVANNDLTARNYPNFTGYNANEALAAAQEGTASMVAEAMNGISDSQAALLVSGAPQTLYTDSAKRRMYALYHATGHAIKSDYPTLNISTLTSDQSFTDILIKYPPKFKYTYIVQFNLNTEYTKLDGVPTSFTFLVKRFTKPKITIEHEEVPFYNFRTSVPKRTIFNPVNMVVHDDIKSESMGFLIAYLRRMSPIMNKGSSGISNSLFERNGLNFQDSSASLHLYTNENNINIIDNITVYHLYNANRTMDVHRFLNPKIETADLGALDMSDATEGCEISLDFVYDSYYPQFGIAPDVPGSRMSMPELGASTPDDLARNGSGDFRSLDNIDDIANGTFTYSGPTRDTNQDPKKMYIARPTVAQSRVQEGFNDPKVSLGDVKQIGIGDSTANRKAVVDDYNTAQKIPLTKTVAEQPAKTVTFNKVVGDYSQTNPAKLTFVEVNTLAQGLKDNNINTASKLGETAVRTIVNSITPYSTAIADKVTKAYFPPDPNQVSMVSKMAAAYKASTGKSLLSENGVF